MPIIFNTAVHVYDINTDTKTADGFILKYYDEFRGVQQIL